jgi:hypothetical protein
MAIFSRRHVDGSPKDSRSEAEQGLRNESIRTSCFAWWHLVERRGGVAGCASSSAVGGMTGNNRKEVNHVEGEIDTGNIAETHGQ